MYRNPGSIGMETPILVLEKKRTTSVEGRSCQYRIELWLTNDEDDDKEGDALCIRESRNDSLRLEGKLET